VSRGALDTDIVELGLVEPEPMEPLRDIIMLKLCISLICPVVVQLLKVYIPRRSFASFLSKIIEREASRCRSKVVHSLVGWYSMRWLLASS
jgi:hypothetical protein